jgi:SAM-dependent methyltransferase
MPEYYALMTDYETSGCDLENKCILVRKAFPDFGIILSVTGSKEYHNKVSEFAKASNIEVLPLPDTSHLEKYHGKIEEGYVGILDLIYELNKREFKGLVYLESDYYPAHREVASRVKSRFENGVQCICNPHPFSDKINNFLGDAVLIDSWNNLFPRTPAIQSPNFILGLSKNALSIIVSELTSKEGKKFLEDLKALTQRRSTDASKYFMELILTTILSKHNIPLGPTWDDSYSPERGVLPGHAEFMQRLHAPDIYFIHGLRQKDYPLFKDDSKILWEFWGMTENTIGKQSNIELITDYPIAIDSPDHLYPWGTMHDNSTSADFISDVERHFGDKKITFLDLGCSGGQLAVDFFLRGHCAIGLEGSDWSIKHNRPNWVDYHNSILFTCDVSRQFSIYKDGTPAKIDCITAWEVTEHIHPDLIDSYFLNIYNHLSDDGVFIGSVAMFLDDVRGGLQVHQSIFSESEWRDKFDKYFTFIEPITSNWVRWSHNGFHHCCVKKG